MEVLRRSSVFAAEIMDAFDRSPTDKELVAQAKALGREFVHARLLRAGLAWSAPERAAPAPGGRLAEVCAVLLRLGDELELIRPSVYRNVARQLNISLQSETVVTDAFLAVASQIFSGDRRPQVCGQHGARLPLPLARGRTLQLRTLPEGCLFRAVAREMSHCLQHRLNPGAPTQEALAPREHPHLRPGREGSGAQSPAFVLEALP
ncbi:bcl-2-related ovarian killer protein isoform X3 [Neomonachus schauinslandi]|uniref:Bcl-2-related ovarian killer protein isoform X3 n=1 Tax=Neomonachus schauinslandi TaxID=29088 RepID=A0A2Y9G6N1_NEOSC|nr:bcl-2-related ovarian killer protein isoform X3 [Neomonachus schauinslandi]